MPNLSTSRTCTAYLNTCRTGGSNHWYVPLFQHMLAWPTACNVACLPIAYDPCTRATTFTDPHGSLDLITRTTYPHVNSFGRVSCPNNRCPDWEGMICVFNGRSDIWKLCSDTSCQASPEPPVSNLDRCDDTLQALMGADEVDDRAKTYCEFKV
jgi:hypothetical protein